MANPTGNIPMVIPVAGYKVIRTGDQTQYVAVQSTQQPPIVQAGVQHPMLQSSLLTTASSTRVLTPVSGLVNPMYSTAIKQEPVDSGYEKARAGNQDHNSSKSVQNVMTQDQRNSITSAAQSSGDGAEPFAAKLSRIASLTDDMEVRKVLFNMLDSKNRDLTVRNFIESSLQKNEDILAQTNAESLKPAPRVIRKDVAKEVSSPWPASGAVSFHITNSSVGRLTDKDKQFSSAESIKNPAGTILRPKSPTRNCSIADKDKTHFSLAAVEQKILDQEADDLFNVCSHELVCALTSNVKFVPKGSGTISEVDIVQYWCNFCPFKTEQKSLLMSHVITHRFHCRYCTYQSFARSDVVQHTKSEHTAEFSTAAQSLRYLTLLPDYLQVKVLQSKKSSNQMKKDKKRKLSTSIDDSDSAAKKKLVEVDIESSDNEKTSVLDGESGEDEDDTGHSGRLVTNDEEYDYFDMEVDEIEDEMPPTDSVETEPMVIVPSKPVVEISQSPTQATTKVSHVVQEQVPLSAMSNTSAVRPIIVSSPTPGIVTNQQMPAASRAIVTNQQMPVASRAIVTNQQIQAASPAIVTNQQMPVAVTQTSINNSTVIGSKTNPVTISTSSTVTSKVATPVQVQPTSNSKSLSVAKNLCWTCGYCEFVSVSQSQLKNHLNLEHRGKAHKYVAMLVNSKGETSNKDDDSTRSGTDSVSDPKDSTNVQPVRNTMKKLASSPLDVDDLHYDSDSQSSDDGDDSNRGQNSFKCAHCKFHSNMYTPVKDHLLDKHQGCLMYAIDMRAIAQRKARYVFFCLKRHCIFHSKKASSFVEHAKSCTPWDSQGNSEDISSHRKQSLVLTTQFAAKIKNKTKQLNDNKDPAQAPFKCSYCIYKSSTLKKVKHHIQQHHEDKQIVVVDTKMKQMKDKFIFVCKSCDYQGSSAADLTKHVENDCEKTQVATDTDDVVDDDESNAPDDSDSALLDSDSSQNIVGDDIEFSESDVERMMADYLEDENKKQEATPGRPLRASAFKAQIKCRVQDPPPMYRCRFCMFHVFGINLMRNHIDKEHTGKSMSALDVKKKHNKRQYLIYFCRQKGCSFKSANASEVDSHALNAHQIKESVRKDNDDFQLQDGYETDDSIPDITGEGIQNSQTNANGSTQAYNCQYCVFIADEIPKLKYHISTKHSDKEYVVNDMHASKQQKPSKVYVCKEQSCLFHTTVSRELDFHNHAHRLASVYECSDCQYFHVNQIEVLSHMEKEHSKTSVSRLTMILLHLGDDGSTIKTETSVKLEAPDV